MVAAPRIWMVTAAGYKVARERPVSGSDYGEGVTITVLVPDAAGAAALADNAQLKALTYDQDKTLTAEQREAEVVVPGFLSADGPGALFDQLPRLRLIQLLSAGAEAWLEHVPAGVALSTCRGAHGGSTAELVIATLLSVYRNLDGFAADQRRGEWNRHGTETLQDKKVLVVGAGDLGQELERRLTPFDASTTLVGMAARAGVHGVDELPELLPHYDAVVMMVPLTTATAKMVDARFLAAMADGAILVNAARGPVVDTDALLAELETKRLRAALDVTDPEPLPAGHPLWNAPNVLITPHVGGNVTGLEERSWRVAAAEIGRYADGRPPRNLVTGEY
jgi:phosphoglycerate dehydrogenase-like enzyme